MGRMLGSHGSDELDRPDLNKCPDCNCFFAGDNCPLCGKECPEEMRAGNRKPVKHSKKRNSGSDRIQFISWYHQWWFILIMLFVFPIAGIVLFITSPHKTWIKILFASVAALYILATSLGLGGYILDALMPEKPPVDTSLNREQYIAACETVDAESYYRGAAGYEDKFVSVTVTVSAKITDAESYYDDKYTTYYICRAADGGEFELLIRDCQQGNGMNFIVGDVITVYGEGAGTLTVYDDTDYKPHTAPCIYMAYATVN